MKNILFPILGLMFFIQVNAQEFNGLKISGDIRTFIAEMKNKGFVFDNQEDNVFQFHGKFAEEDVSIFATITPKSKQLFHISVYFPEKTSWESLRDSYVYFLGALTEKYSDPDETVRSFLYPYEEGDGFELSAVALDKCKFIAEWNDRNNLNLSVRITKLKSVAMSYANSRLLKVYREEYRNRIKDDL